MTTWTIRRAASEGAEGLEFAAEIAELAHEAAEADGINPLDDQVRLDLQHPSDAAAHLVALEDDRLVGYAQIDLRAGDAAGGHLVVRPARRRQGIGNALIARMLDIAGDRPLSVWAHGNREGAVGLAAALNWSAKRELRQLVLPMSTAIPQPSYPESVTVRTFAPGQDEQAWVDVNAAAFAGHPEQGRMTVDDLTQREEQPWFDPAGLFLAERGGELLGSHWTKVHRHDDGLRVGEVYVVGVSPNAQGLGLGKALTLTGLHHLREQGLDVILYVDADNTAAVSLYERIGFTTARVDVMYEGPPTTAAAAGHPTRHS